MDVLDAYEVLHHVLDGMFSGKADRLKRLVDQVNIQKGPSTGEFPFECNSHASNAIRYWKVPRGLSAVVFAVRFQRQTKR